MTSLLKHQTADEPLMAQAFADAVGATKRQIQFWSDHEVLQFEPGSGIGTGNQRRYPRSEWPFAAVARAMAQLGRRFPLSEKAQLEIYHATRKLVLDCSTGVGNPKHQSYVSNCVLIAAAALLELPMWRIRVGPNVAVSITKRSLRAIEARIRA